MRFGLGESVSGQLSPRNDCLNQRGHYTFKFNLGITVIIVRKRVTGEENFQMHRGTSVLIIPARQYLFSTEAAVSVSVRQGVNNLSNKMTLASVLLSCKFLTTT